MQYRQPADTHNLTLEMHDCSLSHASHCAGKRDHSTTCAAPCLLTFRSIHADNGKCCMQGCELSTQIAVTYTGYAHTYEVRSHAQSPHIRTCYAHTHRVRTSAQGTYTRTGTHTHRRRSRQNMTMLNSDEACV